VNKFPLSRHK